VGGSPTGLFFDLLILSQLPFERPSPGLAPPEAKLRMEDIGAKTEVRAPAPFSVHGSTCQLTIEIWSPFQALAFGLAGSLSVFNWEPSFYRLIHVGR